MAGKQPAPLTTQKQCSLAAQGKASWFQFPQSRLEGRIGREKREVRLFKSFLAEVINRLLPLPWPVL